jgi:hypothetical protein
MAQIEAPGWNRKTENIKPADDNKHPADELAEIRLKLKGWEDRADELRAIIIDLPKREREGKRYIATVTEESRRRLNVQAMEEAYGDLSRFYTSTNFTTVRTKRKKK